MLSRSAPRTVAARLARIREALEARAAEAAKQTQAGAASKLTGEALDEYLASLAPVFEQAAAHLIGDPEVNGEGELSEPDTERLFAEMQALTAEVRQGNEAHARRSRAFRQPGRRLHGV